MTLYEQILSLPLFQGLSRDDLNDIVAHTKFEFSKVETGDIIIRENTPCTQLVFLLNGTVAIESHADDNSFSVSEIASAPLLFEPERLFGLTQYYSHNVSAATTCNLLKLSKEEAMRLSDRHVIFRINLLNRLSTDAQKSGLNTWRRRPATLRQRIIGFFLTHSLRPAGRKVFRITIQQLATEIGESWRNVSHQLRAWDDIHLISMSRGKIDIPHLETLLAVSFGDKQTIQLKDNA